MVRASTNNQRAPLRNELALILLAGGYSSRMKAFKPLLPLGDSTVIETAIDTFLYVGIKNIIVVIGYQAEKLKPILNKKGIQWVYNERYSEGMYSSILAGISALPTDVKGFFLLPSDMPLIKRQTIEKICEAYSVTNADLLYPVFRGRRGHPPLISASLFTELLMYDGSKGLKGILAKYREHALHIEVEDEGIHLDMDTYEEYVEIYEKAKGYFYSYGEKALEIYNG